MWKSRRGDIFLSRMSLNTSGGDIAESRVGLKLTDGDPFQTLLRRHLDASQGVLFRKPYLWYWETVFH